MTTQNNKHMVEENYTALAKAVCTQAADDTIRSLKHLNRIMKEYEKEVNKIRDIRHRYDILVKGSSDEESLKEVTKDLVDARSKFTINKSAINKQMWRLNDLQTFFEGEWFYALNGMGLTSEKVCRGITKNVVGKEFDSPTDYIEYFNNRVEDIRIYIVEESVHGISVVYLE